LRASSYQSSRNLPRSLQTCTAVNCDDNANNFENLLDPMAGHVSPTDEPIRGERLQKVLAAAGLGSRRQCEDLIRDGRVEVDRQVVTELGTRVDPSRQEIRVDGESLRPSKRLYFAVNKPVGVVSTNRDPSGRARVIDLVPTDQRVFAVGRLDRSSEGLILVTNDGEFANRLTHPRYGVEKTYLVRVAGAPDQRQLARLKKGVHLAEGFARAQSIHVKKKHGHSSDLIIVLNEGRNREIRRILARVGHKVLSLKRVAVGSVKLGDLPVGGWRRLMPDEVEELFRVAKEKRRAVKSRKRFGEPTKGALHAQKGSPPAPTPDDQYVQKRALLAEPLSLDDLLRDDLDEGPIGEISIDSGAEPGGAATGGVIDYEGELGKTAPGQRRQRGKHWRGKDRRHSAGRREKLESRPRESFGKKRGGKRVFSPQEQGRGPAGEKGGNFRFRPKHKKRRFKSSAAENQRRGERRGQKQGKQFGKGNKGKGRR
jgi:23S rRNA pseudouridine2605 synthase